MRGNDDAAKYYLNTKIESNWLGVDEKNIVAPLLFVEAYFIFT